MIIFSILLVNLLLSYLVGKQGEKKEIGFTNSFLLSFFFSPIISMLFVINSPTKVIVDRLLTEEIIKSTPKLTEGEIQYQNYITRRDITTRIKFLVIFLVIIGVIYLLK